MSHGLQTVRDALVLAREGQYISDAEFIFFTITTGQNHCFHTGNLINLTSIVGMMKNVELNYVLPKKICLF